MRRLPLRQTYKSKQSRAGRQRSSAGQQESISAGDSFGSRLKILPLCELEQECICTSFSAKCAAGPFQFHGIPSDRKASRAAHCPAPPDHAALARCICSATTVMSRALKGQQRRPSNTRVASSVAQFTDGSAKPISLPAAHAPGGRARPRSHPAGPSRARRRRARCPVLDSSAGRCVRAPTSAR